MVWASHSGSGSAIAIVDDGIQYTHGDLNIDTERSFGWNVSTGERIATAHSGNALHGTATAGVASAIRDNMRGGCGVAWGSTLIGVRLLSNDISSTANSVFMGESFVQSLTELSSIDNVVVSNSWGPPDDGRVDGPMHQGLYSNVDDAMRMFYTSARGGLGGIIVFANGNGGPYDNANDDGFASHPTTISVGAVGDDNRRTSYTEPGACVDIVAPSDGGLRGIVTADLIGGNGYANGNFTASFGGTSAATPVVSGVIALMLDARPRLRSVDVRHILVRTARRVHVDDPHWVENSAGIWFSPWYGFGLVDAEEAVEMAREWDASPTEEEICSEDWFGFLGLSDWEWRKVPLTGASMRTVVRVSVFIDVVHPWRGDVVMRIVSPSGTISQLTFEVPNNVPLSDASFIPHMYHSNAFYMESAINTGWTVDFRDVSARGRVRHVRICLSGVRGQASPPSSQHSPPPSFQAKPSHTDTTVTRIVTWIAVGTVLLASCCCLVFAFRLDDGDRDEEENVYDDTREGCMYRFTRRLRLDAFAFWEAVKRT